MAQKKTTTKTVEPVAETAVTKTTPPPVEEPTVVPVPETEVQTDVSTEVDRYQTVLDKLQSFVNDAKELIVVVKTLQKEHTKLQKLSSKKVKKTAVASGDVAKRSPSGFAKPTKLSDDLCTFLGVENGSFMARTLVTKHINEYIKKNNLQDANDKRNIMPDAKLKTILSSVEGDKLTYFNLQTFIKQHFMKE